ncbi:MAG: TolC family protein [Candidatus Nitronauta litoralis]|uniref:TolC family protein n=1 Tax=Candidatus Nitronauta litoralis TaxID=2705533 RepID=A0A7T0FZ46_9BACT|nr:MAG: TolC family protein [Candidatus Nitronauta litoralis]
MKRIRVLVVMVFLTISQTLQPAFATEKISSVPSPEMRGVLTLDRVIVEVLLKNPSLQAFSLEVRAREARMLQAGMWPNPQLQIQAEDITGTGQFDSFRNTQTTVQLSQRIRLGGKIAKTERVAELSKDLAQWDYEITRMNILTRTGQAFIDVLKSQEQMKLAENLVLLADTNLKVVTLRAESGKVSPVQVVKAKVARSKTQLEINKARNKIEAARRRLSITWAESSPGFEGVLGDFFRVDTLPSYESLLTRLGKNPNLERWAAEISHRQAKIELEESKAIPDLQLQGAYRRIEDQQANTLVLGINIPLNIFDRNQGGILEARHRREKADAEQSAIRLQLQSRLADIYTRLSNAHQQATTLKQNILPGARKAFDAVQEGYRYGKFGLIDVLDSQRTLFESRSSYLEALGNYHKAVLDIERIIGAPLSSHGSIRIKQEGKPKS